MKRRAQADDEDIVLCEIIAQLSENNIKQLLNRVLVILEDQMQGF